MYGFSNRITKISYFGDKYLTRNICLVSGCDISMPMKDDRPDKWNTKLGNSRFQYISAAECTSSTLILQLHMERVFL